MTTGRPIALAGFLVGTSALVLQFGATMASSPAAGRSIGGAVLFYLSFFTILTNLLVVLVYSAALWGRPALFRKSAVRAGVAVSIATVAVVYWTVLRQLQDLTGLHYLCNVLLHYVAPPLYVAWWLTEAAEGSTGWRDVAIWLLYPLAYLAYTLARAPIAGEVPYPFLDYAANGATSVALSCLSVAMLFAVLGLVAVLMDHIVGGKRASRQQESR